MKIFTLALFAASTTATFTFTKGEPPEEPSKTFPPKPPYWTTSTIYTTSTSTVTSCPPTYPSCPDKSKSAVLTTVTIPVTTTVCEVTEEPTPTYPTYVTSEEPEPTTKPEKPTGHPPPPPPPPPVSSGYSSKNPEPTTKPPYPTTTKVEAPTTTSLGTVTLPKPTETPPATVPIGAAARMEKTGFVALVGAAVAALLV